MYLYDKHDYAVRECIYQLIPRIPAVHPDRMVFIEIGCGFAARFTGDLVHSLVRSRRDIDPANITIHLVDPALYGYGSWIAKLALENAFEGITFIPHKVKWTAGFAQATFRDSSVVGVFALETTTMMNDGEFAQLHGDLARVLAPEGFFLDVSEALDVVTAKEFSGLDVHSRSAAKRLAAATHAGFEKVAEYRIKAHAATPPDEQEMLGLLLRKANR